MLVFPAPAPVSFAAAFSALFFSACSPVFFSVDPAVWWWGS
ncbi:hypothetical protein ABXI76_03550 [Streptomyces parvus]